MDTAPEPFLLLEADEAPRLEAAPPLWPATALVRRRGSPALAGMAVLGASLLVLWGAWLVSSLFDRWNVLGWIGLACLLVAVALIGLGISREFRSLSALRRVDHLRTEFATGEMKTVQHAARRWLEALPEHAEILPALAGTDRRQ